MAMLAELVDGVIGIDPHRDALTAAAVSHSAASLPAPPSAPTLSATSSCSASRTIAFVAAACGRSRERAASAPA
jgi:hypothetical protein